MYRDPGGFSAPNKSRAIFSGRPFGSRPPQSSIAVFLELVAIPGRSRKRPVGRIEATTIEPERIFETQGWSIQPPTRAIR
jgi:hypothetical protein